MSDLPPHGKALPDDESHVRLGIFWPYGPVTHIMSRELPARNPDYLDLDVHLAMARVVDRLGFDFIFFADGYWGSGWQTGRQNPLYQSFLLAGAIAAVTEHVGLITTIQSTLFEPAHVARIGASLDAMSRGRWGWNIVSGSSPEAEGLFHDPSLGHDERYAMAAEAVQVILRLWDSTPAADVEFTGRYYRVRGRLGDPRPVQRPRPLFVNAGTSEVGRRFAARNCDYLFAPGEDPRRLHAIAASLKDLAAEAGRRRESVAVLTAPIVVLRDSREEAERLYEWMLDTIDWESTRWLAEHHDLRRGTLPRPQSEEEWRTLLRRIGGGQHHPTFVGSPRDVAEQIVGFCQDARPGGLMLNFPLWAPEEIERFGAVLPYLREAGIWRPPAERAWAW